MKLLWPVLLFTGVVARGAEEAAVTQYRTEPGLRGAIDAKGDLLVLFFAPSCEHCKALMGPYTEAAARLATNGVPVKLAKVDAVRHPEMAKAYGVAGYPTLRYFKENEVQVMDGASAGRTADEVRAC